MTARTTAERFSNSGGLRGVSAACNSNIAGAAARCGAAAGRRGCGGTGGFGAAAGRGTTAGVKACVATTGGTKGGVANGFPRFDGRGAGVCAICCRALRAVLTMLDTTPTMMRIAQISVPIECRAVYLPGCGGGVGGPPGSVPPSVAFPIEARISVSA
jgi:hypothetical protein